MNRNLRVLSLATLVLLSACGGRTEEEVASATPQSEPTVTAQPDAAPTAEAILAEPAEPPDWERRLVEAFAAYDATRAELDAQVGRTMGELSNPTEQDFFDVLADQMVGWADAGDRFVAAVPAEVDPEIEPVLASVLTTHEELLKVLRQAAVDLRAGETGTYESLLNDPTLSGFRSACAELQFAVLDRGGALIACGTQGEDPEEPMWVEGPTVEHTDELIAMPVGSYQLGYVGPSGAEPLVIVGLEYGADMWIRSSLEVVEIAADEAGPTLRIHANQLATNPNDLQTTEVRDFWVLMGDPSGWIDMLPDVSVTETGADEISGLEAMYWNLVNEGDGPIAVLGDGDGWVPDTVLQPGQPTRLWWVMLDPGVSVYITQQAADGSADFTGFDDLLAGLVFELP